MPREHDVPLYERLWEGESDAWGWYLERRPDGWYVGDTFGERLIAAPSASYKTAYSRGAVVATRTNQQFVETAWSIRMPDEESARMLHEILDRAHAPAPTIAAQRLCDELGYRWDAEWRACRKDGFGAAVAEIKLADLGVVVHRRDEWPCVAAGLGGVAWERIQGWDRYLTGRQPEAARRLFADLVADFQSLHDRAVDACGAPFAKEDDAPGCSEIAHEIVDWADRRDVDAKAVQGWFDGRDDWYHWWAEVRIAGRCYIVDGTRNQFFPATHRDPVLIVIPCSSRAARDYRLRATQ
jgi:hypothetical protein